MSAIAALLPDLDRALSSGPVGKRAAMLTKMTDLFLQTGAAMPEPAGELIDDIILHIASAIESGVRRELALKLADDARAPPKTVAALAQQSIDVSQPLLARSMLLSDETLVAVSESNGDAHRLAIARRATLSEPVTDSLVTLGGTQVLHTVTGNTGAQFSDTGFDMLINRSAQDEALQRLLADRRDLPLPHIRRLVDIAGGAALGKLRATLTSVDSSVLSQAIGSEIGRVRETIALTTAKRNYRDAHARISTMAAARQLSQQDVLQFAIDMKMEEMVSALAVMTRLSILTVETVLDRKDHDQLLIIGKSLGFTWATVRAVMSAGFEAAPSSHVLETLLDQYERLSAKTASRIVKFLSEREAAMHKNG